MSIKSNPLLQDRPLVSLKPETLAAGQLGEINPENATVATATHHLKIIRQGSLESIYRMPMEVNWLLTSRCNYRCSYCPQRNDSNRSQIPDFQDIKRALEHLASANRDIYNITLSGGEPTIHPHIFDIILYMSKAFGERLNFVTLITNGSRQNDLYNRLAAIAKEIYFNFLVSIHTEFVEPEHIYELANLLAPAASLHFSLMFNPAKRDLVREIHTRLCDLRQHLPFNCTVTLLRAGQCMEYLDKRYLPQDFVWRDEANQRFNDVAANSGFGAPWKMKIPRKMFWDYLEDGIPQYICGRGIDRDKFIRTGMLGFKGMWCMTGANMANIHADGSVTGAQCSLVKPRLNIFRHNPYAEDGFLTPMLCNVENCGCAANFHIPKFLSKQEADDFAATVREKQAMLRNDTTLCDNLKRFSEEFDETAPRQILPEEIGSILSTLKPNYFKVDSVNPDDTMVIVLADALEEAVRHYSSLNGRQPDFLIADWDGRENAKLATVSQSMKINIKPVSEWRKQPNRKFCLYARKFNTHCHKGGFSDLAALCFQHGLAGGYGVDSASLNAILWHSPPDLIL